MVFPRAHAGNGKIELALEFQMAVQAVYPARFLIIQDNPVAVNFNSGIIVVKVHGPGQLSISRIHIQAAGVAGPVLHHDSGVLVRVKDAFDLLLHRDRHHRAVRDNVFH